MHFNAEEVVGMKSLILLMFFFFAMSAMARERPIAIYSYHTDPPFHLPHISTDLSRIFVDHLNQFALRQGSDVDFKLVTIRRPDLNALVEAGEPYVILWANRAWFVKRDKNIRTTDAIFYDADVWISAIDQPIRYGEPNDLIGKTFGGRAGYYYKGINPLVDASKVNRIDSLSDRDNFLKLEAKEIDLYVMSRSSLLYWFSNGFDASQVYVAQSPHDAFTRHLLYSKHHEGLASLFDAYLESVKRDRRWKNKLNFWGLDTLTTPFELELDELINYPLGESKP